MNELSVHLTTLWEQAVEIWRAGGWAMIAIAIISFVMFGLGSHVHLRLLGKGFTSTRRKNVAPLDRSPKRTERADR